jgi:hypothetical protein
VLSGTVRRRGTTPRRDGTIHVGAAARLNAHDAGSGSPHLLVPLHASRVDWWLDTDWRQQQGSDYSISARDHLPNVNTAPRKILVQ